MTAVARRQRGTGIEWGAPASLLMHALLLALLVFYLPKHAIFSVPDEGSVSVDIVPSPSEEVPVERTTDPRWREREAIAAQPAPSVTGPTFKPLQPPAIKVDPPADALIQVRRLYSGATLNDPRSGKARTALRQLSGDERNLQLCGLEAMEQVRRSRAGMQPDAIVPYAMGPEKINGNSIDVQGGAFRSARNWYALRFRCEVDGATGVVRSFAFAVGDAIPHDLWRDHNLVADDGPVD